MAVNVRCRSSTITDLVQARLSLAENKLHLAHSFVLCHKSRRHIWRNLDASFSIKHTGVITQEWRATDPSLNACRLYCILSQIVGTKTARGRLYYVLGAWEEMHVLRARHTPLLINIYLLWLLPVIIVNRCCCVSLLHWHMRSLITRFAVLDVSFGFYITTF